MRLLTLFLITGAALVGWNVEVVRGQGMALPSGTNMPVPRTASSPTPPSMQNQAARAPLGAAGGGKLPRSAGQEHRVYDLRPYTGYLTKTDRPEQAVIDWVLRETGTDVWFTQPFGFLSADRDSLSVYHTSEMHQVVGSVVERFVAGDKDPQVLGVRVMNVGNPNWRSRAQLLMQHVTVDSPGVQAWLLSKENAAMVMQQLRQRTDTRLVHDLNLVIHNGQTQKLASTRGKNYVRNVRQAAAGWPPYEPETGEIQEGYNVEISPLLSTDGRTIDCVINAKIDQLDKLFPVELELPLPNNQTHRARIDVPQVVSWRLHERFRWPSDMILLLSCGVVASPDREQSSVPFLNMDMLTGTSSGRADALMFIQFKGRAADNLTNSAAVPQVATQPNPTSRGRY
ncbi:MAG: hypothetical protein ACR2NZ_01595 [Rubripirellula sp.]